MHIFGLYLHIFCQFPSPWQCIAGDVSPGPGRDRDCPARPGPQSHGHPCFASVAHSLAGAVTVAAAAAAASPVSEPASDYSGYRTSRTSNYGTQ